MNPVALAAVGGVTVTTAALIGGPHFGSAFTAGFVVGLTMGVLYALSRARIIARGIVGQLDQRGEDVLIIPLEHGRVVPEVVAEQNGRSDDPYVCDLCGQLLTPPLRCNSGLHETPDIPPNLFRGFPVRLSRSKFDRVTPTP